MTPKEQAKDIADRLGSFASNGMKSWLADEIELAIRGAYDKCAAYMEARAGQIADSTNNESLGIIMRNIYLDEAKAIRELAD